MEFVAGLKAKMTLKKESLKQPVFNPKILKAIDETLEDGKERTVGNIAETVIIRPFHPLVKEAKDYDKYKPVSVYVVTGFQEYMVKKD